jgi:anti-sigma factor RsiW
LMKGLKPRGARAAVVSRASSQEQPRPARCKAMFAELSNYLDEQLDDSLCEELERHLGGCEPCKAFLSSLEATIDQCRISPAECPPSRQAVRLRRQLLKNYEQALAVVRPK